MTTNTFTALELARQKSYNDIMGYTTKPIDSRVEHLKDAEIWAVRQQIARMAAEPNGFKLGWVEMFQEALHRIITGSR